MPNFLISSLGLYLTQTEINVVLPYFIIYLCTVIVKVPQKVSLDT